MRRTTKKHAPLKPLIAKLALGRVLEIHHQHYDVVSVVKTSAFRAWADFFPKPEHRLKPMQDAKTVPRDDETLEEVYARMDAAADAFGGRA